VTWIIDGGTAVDEGEEFGPYRLQRLVGRGGMGEVYEAHDTVQDRQVAVKRLLAHMADDTEFQQRFRRESRLAARLRDPHVIPIHTYGEIDGRLFIDMRLIRGQNLHQVLADEGRLTPERAVSVVSQVARALDAAHAEGLVHRDVKPSNILLGPDPDGEDFVYLVDFGISRASGDSQVLTASGMVMGSVDYMAPERFDGTAGPEADVYSLGCVLFQCLTGSPPFRGESMPELMRAHLGQEPPAPSLCCPDVPAGIDAVIARALAKDPAERPRSATELGRDAQAALTRRKRTTMELPVPVAEGPGGTEPVAASPEDADPVGKSAEPETVRVATAHRPPKTPAAADDLGRSGVGPAGGAGGNGRSPSSTHVDFDEVFGTRRGSSSPPRDTSARAGTSPRPPGSSRPRSRRWLMVLAAAGTIVLVLLIALLAGRLTHPTPAPSPVTAAPRPEAPPPPPARSSDHPTVAATFSAANGPETVAVSPDGQSLYVTATGAKPTIDVYDTTGHVVTSIPCAGPPYFIALSPEGNKAYVTLYDPTQDQLVVGVIDTRVNMFSYTIPTGQAAHQGSLITWLFGLGVSPDGAHLYVPNHHASTVSVLDTAARKPVAEIAVPVSPHWVALTPDGHTAYVTNHVPGQITVIDTVHNAVVGEIAVGPGQSPHSIAVSPDGRTAEFVNYEGDTVSFIDTATNTVTATVPVGKEPQSVAFAPDGAHSYVVNEDSGDLSVVRTSDHVVTATIPIGKGASMIAVSPDGKTAYVTAKEANTVTVVGIAN